MNPCRSLMGPTARVGIRVPAREPANGRRHAAAARDRSRSDDSPKMVVRVVIRTTPAKAPRSMSSDTAALCQFLTHLNKQAVEIAKPWLDCDKAQPAGVVTMDRATLRLRQIEKRSIQKRAIHPSGTAFASSFAVAVVAFVLRTRRLGGETMSANEPKDSNRNRSCRCISGCPRAIRRSQWGFTLLELLIVISILGILATISIATYLDYTVRTYMMEAIVAASSCRSPVSESYYLNSIPPTAGNWGCESTGPGTTYVSTIAVDENGKVIVTVRGFGDPQIDGKILTLTPFIDGRPASSATDMGRSVQSWRCGSSADGTNIPDQYLPHSCRTSGAIL